MWIPEKMSGKTSGGAFIAGVEHSDGESAALSGTDGGSAALFVPYGLECSPPKGVRAAVVRAGERLCVVGFECGSELSLEPGEIGLRSAGGATIILKNDGRVLINGQAV